MIRNVLTGSILLSAAPVAAAAVKDDKPKEATKYRPSDLPIYSTIYAKDIKKSAEPESESIIRSSIEGGVKVVRECCCDCVNSIKDKKKPVDEFVSTGVAHSQCKPTLYSNI